MYTKKEVLRILAVFLSMVIIIATLTSCFRETISYEASESDASMPYEAEAAVGTAQSDDAPSPSPAGEIFAEGVGQVLMNTAGRADLIASSPFDILLNPGMQSGDGSDYTNTTLRMTQIGEEETETTYAIEKINNVENGDASMVIDMLTGDGESSRCGLYFYENMMLVRKANAENPMVLHALNPQVSDSYFGLTAFKRYIRVMNDTNAPRLSDDDWRSDIDAYLALVADIAKQPDFSAGEETATYAGMQVSCTASTLKLMGERALAVTRGLIDLIAQDTALQSLFSAPYNSDGEARGVTGLDGMLRDIDALDDDERKAAIMTFKLVEVEAPVGIYLTLTAGDETFRLSLVFFEDGYIRHNEITFEGFDGSSAVLQDVNVSGGADAYAENFIYDIKGPDGTTQENMTAAVSSTVTDLSYNAGMQVSYMHAASEDMDAFGFSGDLSVSQVIDDGGSTDSTVYGTLEIVEADEAGTYDVDMTSVQSCSTVGVTPPEFLQESGISTADQYSLYDALGDFDGAAFVMAPATTQMLSGLLLLLN